MAKKKSKKKEVDGTSAFLILGLLAAIFGYTVVSTDLMKGAFKTMANEIKETLLNTTLKDKPIDELKKLIKAFVEAEDYESAAIVKKIIDNKKLKPQKS